MKIIRAGEGLAFPVIKIDCVEIDEDEAYVKIITNGTQHDLYYKTSAKAREAYDSILDAMEY